MNKEFNIGFDEEPNEELKNEIYNITKKLRG